MAYLHVTRKPLKIRTREKERNRAKKKTPREREGKNAHEKKTKHARGKQRMTVSIRNLHTAFIVLTGKI